MNAFFLQQGTLPIGEVPVSSVEDFRSTVVAACDAGARIIALPCFKLAGHERVFAFLAHDGSRRVQVVCMRLPENRRYPALTTDLPQAQAFERELAEDHGITPDEHPWPKPLRRHTDLEQPGCPDAHPFFRVEGAGVHEVAVGPVHAGIIEPGHFRFQCYGETVHHLEIQLGYQKRGVERLLLASSPSRRLVVAESIAGDTVIGHGLAHLMTCEKLAGVEPTPRAQSLRAIALELERLANHTGDLGALCNDVGYLPGASWYGRLRGDFLNLLMDLSGNRFGRGLVRLGGVAFDLAKEDRAGFSDRFDKAVVDFDRIAEVIFEAPAVESRFEGTGSLTRDVAEDLGLVGPVARACGCDRDVRRDHPDGAYRTCAVDVAVRETGDVLGRAEVRRLEVGHAAAFIRSQLHHLPDGALRVEVPAMRPGMLSVAMLEGWRGEIVHVAATDEDGRLLGYNVVDPSFHNWFGLAIALRGNPISDFPLCNKSFNLSYAGHDL